MSRIATIHRNLAETTAILRSYESTLADNPDTGDWIQHDIRSLSKLRRQLEREFAEAANDLQVDECRYRLFRDGDNPPLLPVVSILNEFQLLVALVFHAMDRKAPLERGTLDAATIANTSFRIGYSFEGSVGFVLTLPNERITLLPDMTTMVDDAIETVFSLSSLRSPQDIRSVASRFGRPIVRACYRWANYHTEAAIGSHAEWKRGSTVRSKMFVQYQEFAALRGAIDQASDEQTEEIKVPGVLTGANVTTKTFQFAIEGAAQVRGTFDGAISADHAATLPSKYTAHLRRTWSVNYATDEVKERWFLIRLE